MQKNFLERSRLRASRQTAISGNLSVGTTNGVIYCRVSSKEQIEGTSLESQEIACKEYAQVHGIKILRTFIERGESAKVADRTQLIELIDFCRTSNDSIQALLVWRVDRFARNVGDHFNIKAALLKYGVRVISVTEPIDTNPEGKLMETILAGFAQFDNDIRAARTVQGMRRKLQEGIFPWKPPLGYRSAVRESTKKTVPDEPDQPVFGLLQKAWQEFLTGAYRKADILRLMDSWGVQTANGIAMTAQSLDNLFRNGYYAGLLADPWTGETFPGKHVPMLSPEDFEHAQALIARRNCSTAHTKERPEFPLRGVARCTVCRHPLTAGFSKGRSKRYGYYRCVNRNCTSKPNYRARIVHDEFGALLDHISPKTGLMKILGNRILRAAEQRQATWKTRNSRHDAELKRLGEEIQELIRMKTQGLVTEEEFAECKTRITERQRGLTALTMPERFDAARIRAALEEVMRPLSELKVTWSSIPTGFHRRFNHMVLPIGFVVGESRTAELGPIFRALDDFGHGNSQEVPLAGETLNQLIQAIQAFADLFGEIGEEKKAA